MENDKRIWELLAKKSAGEAGGEELRELHDLLQYYGTDVDYMMNVMEHYWEEISASGEDKETIQRTEAQKDKALYETGQQKLSEGVFPSNKGVKKKKMLYWSMSIAAAACIFLSWILWRPLSQSKQQMNVVMTKDGSRMKVTLPDSSEVWLNSGSKLIYSKNLNHLCTREVTLSGEAYFKVKHDTNHPFIIHTDYLDIKDLGTVFNVKAYPDEKEAVATLISGSIAVSIKDDPGRTIVLKPHEKVSYFADIHGLSLEKDNPKSANKELKTIRPVALHNSRLEVSDIQPVVTPHGDTIVSETAWVNNELVFQGEKFLQLAERMQRWYNVTIKVENAQVADYTFTGIFDGETLSQALEELNMIRSFSFELRRDTVVIK